LLYLASVPARWRVFVTVRPLGLTCVGEWKPVASPGQLRSQLSTAE